MLLCVDDPVKIAELEKVTSNHEGLQGYVKENEIEQIEKKVIV